LPSATSSCPVSRLSPSTSPLDQLRLLIGNVTNRQTIEQLPRIVRDYNLEEAYRAIVDRAEEAPLIPRIVCSDALL